MQRVVVLGVTGTGKTTFAAALAARVGAPHIELDALHWEPHWKMAELDVFRERVGRAVAADRWIVDGNYSKARDLVWSRADTLIWLDYAFGVTLVRLVRRTLGRVVSGQELWNGNRERFAEQFLSRDSIFVWAVRSYRAHKASYPALLASTHYAHVNVIHHRTPRAAEAWLATVEQV